MTVVIDGTAGITTPDLTDSSLTSGRVVYAGTDGNLTGSSTFVFDGTNLGVGTTSPASKLHVYSSGQLAVVESSGNYATSGSGYVRWKDVNGNAAFVGFGGNANNFDLYNALAGALTFSTNSTERMRIDSSGNLLVGASSSLFSARITASTANTCAAMITTTSAEYSLNAYNSATSGNNNFILFQTEGTPTTRGSISYNRGAGLVAYNVTSDYRAKDIIGPVQNSGSLIDSVPVYMGKMKGATQDRPMFIAHETPEYAHTGEKDAVDADGNPVYQQMDASALIPVMWAEIQSLRARVASLESN